MLNQVKKIVSIVLLVAMVITNNGFSVLATTVEQTSGESSEEIFESKKENISEPALDEVEEIELTSRGERLSEPEVEDEEELDPTDGANDPTDGANDPTDGANVEPGVGANVHGARPESEEELDPTDGANDPTRRGERLSEPEEEEEDNLTEANADTDVADDPTDVANDPTDVANDPTDGTNIEPGVGGEQSTGLFSVHGAREQSESKLNSSVPAHATASEILPEEISDENETELTTVVDDIASVSEILIEEKKLNQIFGADDHTHKVCGIAPDLFCDHRGIESHGGEITYVPFFGEAVMTDEEIVDKIIAGGSYYLDKDINLPNVAQIRLTSDLYLCLNGKSVNNLFFGSGSNNDNKIYITNCILEQSTISREGDSVDFIVNHSDVSVIAPYSNIELNQATRFLYNVTTTNSKFDLYGLTFTTSATWPLTNSLIRSDSPGSEINMSHIYMSGFTTDGAFGYIQTTGSDSNKNKLNIRESKFEYLEHTGEGSIEKSLVWISHCDAVINSTSFVDNSTGQIFYNTGSGTSDFRSVIMNNNTTLIWVVNLNYTTNNFDGVDIVSNRWNSDTNNGGSLLELKYNAVLNVKSGGLKINYNTEFAPTPAVMYLNFDVVLNVEEGATCEITNNTLPYYDASFYSVFTICPGAVAESSYTMNILGNFIVEDNNIVNATVPGTKPFAAIYLPNNKQMTMGNGTIKVQNNFIYSDGETRADETVSEFYHMYQVLTDNTNGVFVQSPGTELSTESRMTVAFASSPYDGIIVDSWTHSDPTAYKTIFSADKYRDDEFELIKDADNKLRIMSHVHKICGYKINEDCNHRGIATHSEIQSYALFFGGAELTDAEKRSKLRGGSYRLDADVTLDSALDINLSSDLYLCLNGHTLYNAVFQTTSINSRKLYITNCQKTEATISRITGEATFIINYSNVSIIAPYKNINLINSNRFKFEASSGSNKLDLYGTTFSQNPSGKIYRALISTNRGGSVINLSNINISKYEAGDITYGIIDVGGSSTSKANLNIYESTFADNDDERNYHYRNNIVYASHCNTNIYDTVFKGNTTSSIFTNVSSGTSYLKNVDITNNETFGQIINLNNTTNDFDNVNVLNNTRGITSNNSGVEAKSNAVLNIKSGGMRINNNKQGVAELDVVYVATNGVLNVEEGSTLEINDNVATYIAGTRAVYSVLLGSNDGNWTMNILGNLYIENNKLVSAPDTMTITYAGLYVNNNRNINIGNGIIRIQNNNIYTDAEGTVLSDALHPYQMLSSNTDGFLVQSPGTEIDVDSKMEVAFDVAPYTGTIINSWTHSDPKAFKSIFSADKYRDDEFEVVKYGNKLGIMTHAHKICGFEADVECDHRGIATHSEVVSYPAFFAGSDLTDEQIVNKLTAGGSYRLDRNIELASPRNIGISADLFLCLNGFNMKNVVFYNESSNNNKLYITNCKNEKVTISKDFSDNTGNFAINHSKVSIIAPYKNITLYNSFRIRYALTTAAPIFDLYGLTISREGSTSIASSIIGTTAAGSEINISNIHISGFTSDSWFGYIQSNGSSVNKNKLNIYESKFDNIIHTGEGGVSKSLVHASHCDTIIHDTDFVDNKTGQIFYNTDSGTSDVKNVTMKNNTVLTWVVNVNYTTNNFDNVDIINNNWNNSGNSGALFDLKNNAILNVKSGGLRLNNNTELNTTPTVLYITSNAVLNVEEGAALEIKNNKLLYYNSNHSVFTICPGNYNTQDYTMNIFGNFYVEDNKIINATTPASHPFAAVCFQRDRQMTVGNSIIKVQNNFIYSDSEGKTRADEKVSEYYHMYQVLSDSTNGTFVLSPGTEMSTDSRMEMAFSTSPYLGVIVDNWSHSDPDAYKTIFSADKFRDIDMMVVKDKDNKVRLMTHSHKVCGHAVDEDCTHTLVATHSEVYSYFPVTTAAIGTNGSYRLNADISYDTPTQINLNGDLYICLNGHNLKNVYFNTTANHSLYITNCKTTKSTLDTNTNTFFTKSNTELYGIDKNITLKTGAIYNPGASGDRRFYCYSVNFTGNDIQLNNSLLTSIANTTIYCEDTIFNNYNCNSATDVQMMFFKMEDDSAVTNAISKFKNIKVSNLNNLTSRLLTVAPQSEMYWYGTNVMENNSYSKGVGSVNYSGVYIRGLFKVCDGTLTFQNNQSLSISRNFIMAETNGKIEIDEEATVVIQNNQKIYLNGYNNSFVLINADGSKIHGSLKILNNKVVNTTTNTTSYLSGMCIGTSAIEVGDKPIIVQGNTCDGNPSTSVYQHLFQVISSKADGFITQKAGTEMSTDSRMEVSFTDAPYLGIVVDNWSHSDPNAYKTIFSADKFRDIDMMVVKDKDNKVRLMTHSHKVCGHAVDEDCTHTLVATHSDVYSYFPMTGVESIVPTLDSYRLEVDIVLDTPTVINASNDLHICLNGHNVKNIYFTSTGGHTIYITNCKNKKVTFDTNTTEKFTTAATEIYGVNKNITFKTAGIYAGSASTSHFYTYSVDFTQNSTSFSDSLLNSSANKTIYCEDTKFDNYELLPTDTGETMFHYMPIDDAQTNAITKFKNITASNIKNLNSRIMSVSSSAEMYWYGTNVVENISYKKRNDSEYTGIHIRGLFKIEDGTLTVRNNESANNSRDFMIIYNGVLYVEENASFVIDNNKKIYSPSTSNSFLKITATGSKIYGTLKIINNSIVQATSNTGVYLSAMQIDSGATIEIGNKPIIVQGNTSDGDPKTSIYQYLYQVLSFNINGFLTQKSGTEMHPDSRMQVQFADSPFKGVIANNWEHSDSAIYDTIFTADTFRDPNLVVNLNQNKQVEIITGGHLHKPCGVDKTTYCSHKGIDDHNYGIPYEDFSNGIDITDDTAVKNRLQAGGYYYLTEELKPSANQPIVLEADLYLCLNGFNMSNISFRDVNSNRKVFITNCSYAEVVITQETETLFNILSSNIVAAKGGIRVVANGFFNVSYNTNALSLDCNFYNIISLPHDPSASSYQLFKLDNSTNQECKYVISKCIFKDHKKDSSSVLPIMYHRNVTGRVYDTDFIGIDTINSSFLVYEGSDLLYNKCNFNNITTGTTGTGSLFRADKIDKIGEVKDSELTLEDVTIEGCTMNRSFVEINEIAQATVNVNNSFTAINNTVNKTGGNNFFNTKSLKLNDASLILKSNVSSNDGMPGLVRSQNSIELYNSYINISDNTIKRNSDGAQSILAVDNGNIKISDNSYLVIKNNKINTDGVNGNNNVIAALNLADGQTISIENGTSYVDISGNEAIGEYKDLDNNHVYQLYMTTADLFKIQNGGLIDMSKSYAEIALPVGTPTGVLFPVWNATTVKDWNANIHKNHFTASNFGNARKDIVINHFKHKLHLDIISDSMDKTGEPLIPTPSNAEAHDEYGNDFVWWLAKTVKDAYGNDVELSEAEKNRPLYIGTKWTSAADNLYRTVFDLEPIYATAYTVTLHANGHGYGPNKQTEVYNEGVKGDPFNLKQVFTPDRNYTFLYYNTKADGSGLRYNTGNYPQGLIFSRDDKLDLYAIYQYQKPPRDDDSSSTNGGGSGSGTINGPIQIVDYSYVEYPYHVLERVSIELSNTVIWQKTDTSWNAFRVKYNNNAIVGYELLTDGLYFINWRNKNCYYAFDKAGNMISGFITYKGNIYCMAPTGTYQGAMIRSNAIIYDKDYIFAETGELTTVMKNYPGFVFDMDVGQYRYAMIGTNGPTYAVDTMIKLKQKDGSVISYYFDKQGLMKVGLITYNNDIYFAYDTGTKYGQAMKGFMGAFNVLTNKLSEIHFNEDHSLDKIVIK